jgi:hypothetical protein
MTINESALQVVNAMQNVATTQHGVSTTTPLSLLPVLQSAVFPLGISELKLYSYSVQVFTSRIKKTLTKVSNTIIMLIELDNLTQGRFKRWIIKIWLRSLCKICKRCIN